MTSAVLNLDAWEDTDSRDKKGEAELRFFNRLLDEHSDRLFRYAYWLCKNRAMAEDLVQETFLRAWKALDSLNDVQAAQGWLFTILRRENARQYERVQPVWSDEDLGDLAATATAYDTSTEAFVLRRALATLPAEYREPLVLQVVGGYSYDEIAEHLQVSKSAVTSRLFRARQKLHELLTGD